MTQPAAPPNSGAPQPVQGVTGGPAVLGGQISNDPNDGSIVVAPNPGNVFQLRKGANPQGLQIYERFDNNTNYTRLGLYAQTNGPFRITTESQGGVPNGARELDINAGTVLKFQLAGVDRETIGPAGTLISGTPTVSLQSNGSDRIIAGATQNTIPAGGLIIPTGTIDFTGATVIANLATQFIQSSGTVLSTGIWTDLTGAVLTLAAGKYIFLCEFNFNTAANASTMNAAVVPSTTGSSGTPTTVGSIGNVNLPANAVTFYGITSFAVVTAGNYKLQGFTSAAGTSMSGRMTTIRIG